MVAGELSQEPFVEESPRPLGLACVRKDLAVVVARGLLFRGRTRAGEAASIPQSGLPFIRSNPRYVRFASIPAEDAD